jgi:uncharacterized protein with PIN domain
MEPLRKNSCHCDALLLQLRRARRWVRRQKMRIRVVKCQATHTENDSLTFFMLVMSPPLELESSACPCSGSSFSLPPVAFNSFSLHPDREEGG